MTKAEKERLIKLMEECAEVIQIGSKILQYGYDEHYPKDPHNNRERLENELGDVKYWMWQLYRYNDVNIGNVEERARNKHAKAMQYTQHQPDSTWGKLI